MHILFCQQGSHVFNLGVNARRPAGSMEADFDAPPTQFHTIMQKLFPILLSLACAAESVARQLFEPLIMSLVHWLTRSARRSARATHAVIHICTSPHKALCVADSVLVRNSPWAQHVCSCRDFAG